MGSLRRENEVPVIQEISPFINFIRLRLTVPLLVSRSPGAADQAAAPPVIRQQAVRWCPRSQQGRHPPGHVAHA
jgi:hypothetical protein